MGQERGSEETPRGGRPLGRMVVVGLIATALGIALGLIIDWFPVQGSTQAEDIDTLWDVLLICSIPAFVLVATVVLFSVSRFRMRPGEENLDGPPIHGSTRLEVIWTAIPAILMVALCTYSYIVLVKIEEAPADSKRERHVTVFGEQFTWTFEYNEGGKKFKTAQLYVPEGESVKFNVKSRDVIHDFWVPAWRMKIDAVPGITTTYRVTPKLRGSFPVVCAELCGLGHAFMRQTAHVVSQADFDAWVGKQGRQQAQAGEASDDGASQSGGQPIAAADAKQLYLQGNDAGATACAACHTLADAGASAQIGPNLDETLKGKDAAYIRDSITDPEKVIAEGFGGGIMPPNYGELLSEAELEGLVKYLAEVTSK